MKKAKDIMTTDVMTVTPQTTVIDLAKLISDKNINGLPVVDEHGILIGVVTENDLIFQKKKVHIPTMISILDSVIYLESPEKMKQEMKKITGLTVNEIYTPDPVSVHLETTIEEIATLMSEENIHTIPVVNEDNLVGVIGKGDIIKTLIG